MRGGLTRLMVCFWLLMAALSSYALEPGVDAEPQLTPAVAVLMGQRMTVRDEKALSGILGEFMKGQPLAYWSEDGRLGRLLTALDDLATDGLNPADYSIERLRQWQRSGAPNVEQEEVATRAYLLALLHLYRGKVDPAALDAHWNFASAQLELNALLVQARTAVDRSEPAAAFNFARPVRPEYNLLRTALARYRGLAYEGGWPAVPAGKPLKPGMTDPRVLVLRNRLQIAGLASREPQLNPALYDDELALDVIRFQREAYLTPDGAIGPSTLAALNLPVARRIDQLRANLERMRWVHDPGTGPMVVVDIAGFRISYLKEGKPIWASRVQVGRSYRSTPVFTSKITHLTLSPTWTVPPTIMAKDVLPKIRKNPNYLTRNRMRVYTADGQAIPARSVNWSRPGNIIIRQDAGEDNSLGQLAIRFPNSYSVYLHDTPHKELFASSQRAFSSGCIRVENIQELAVLLLDDPEQWSRAALDAAIGTNKTRQVNLVTPIHILLVYWTVDVASDGYVAFKADIYDRDRPLVMVLDQRLTP